MCTDCCVSGYCSAYSNMEAVEGVGGGGSMAGGW